MTAQCFLTVLLFMVSHGMEVKDLEFFQIKYIITEHFDITFLGCPVEINMYKKSLNHRNWTAAVANDSKLASILSPSLLDSITDLVPAVIVRCHNGMDQRIGYISEEIFKHENKVVMDFGNKNLAWTLHRVVNKDAKPYKLVWSNLYGQKIVFTRKGYLESNPNLSESALLEKEWKHEFAAWKQQIVTYLSKFTNRNGVSLTKLGEIFGTPRGFEKLKQAIKLVPCVSVFDFLSENTKTNVHVAILKLSTMPSLTTRSNDPLSIMSSLTTKSNDPLSTMPSLTTKSNDPLSTMPSLTTKSTTDPETKSWNKEQTLTLYPDSLKYEPLARTLSPEIENMSNYLDDGTGKEVILDNEMENKLLPEDLLSPRQGKTSNYEAEQKYLKNLHPKKD